jgi:hypothetical protein
MIQKRILPFALLLLILACGQEKNLKQSSSQSKSDFDSKWEKIEFLENKGLQGNLIQELNFILKTALEEKNYPQIFKALAIRSRHIHQIEEDSEQKIIESFHDAISQSDAEGRRLLQSALAELYQQYYQQNRFKIRERSSLSDSNRREITQMSGAELESMSDQLYLRSVSFDDRMNAIPISDYLDVLRFWNEDSSYLGHFSLADFLANRALLHFEGQFNQSQLAERVLASEEIFAAKPKFLARKFAQQCIQTDLRNWMAIITDRLEVQKDEFSLIHFELYRLNTLRRWSTNDSLDQLYFESLKRILEELEGRDSKDRIRAEMARFMHLTKKDAPAALQLCKACEDPKSLGAALCEELTYEISRKHHELQVEAAYATNRNILFAYAYKNIETVYFKLYPLPIEIERQYSEDRNWLIKLLKSAELKSWHQELKVWTDYQLHRTELKMEGLTNGNYLLIASDRPTFDPDSSQLSIAEFWVSDIACLMRRDEQSGNLNLFFKDRTSGEVLEDVKVSLYQFDRNQKAEPNWNQYSTLKSDKEGVVRFKGDEKYLGNYRMKVEYEDQVLMNYHSISLNHLRSKRNQRSSLQFFTDRKVYQPGQFVRFKAILSTASEYEESVVPNSENEIRLIDPRGQVLTELKLTTNDFGSLSGTFQLPLQALNGFYRIVSAKGSSTIRVEEYRRPSFEVVFDKEEQIYSLGDSVSISGKLITYTGMPVNQANISYRVIQEDQQPIPLPYSSYWPPAKRVLISSGEIQLKDNSFDIRFKSQEGGRFRKERHYTLELNVSSPLGENVAADKTLQIHRLPYSLKANIDQSIQLQELNELKIQAINHSGEDLQLKGSLELWSLESPEKVSVEKYWGDIDHQIISEEAYRKVFPFYNYTEARTLASFTKKDLISKQAFRSNEALNTYQNLKAGAYLIKAYSISDEGDTISLEKRFTLFDAKAKKQPYPMDLWSHLVNDSLIQGETIDLILGTGFEGFELMVELEYRGKPSSSKKIKLNSEQKSIRFNTEGMEGPIVVHLSGVKQGRTFTQSHQLKVYPKTKSFEIFLKTKRDYTEPASREKWSIGIKDLAKDSAVEVLASMYDKSLDQLENQSWNPLSSIYFRRKIYWMSGFASNLVVGRQYTPPGIHFKNKNSQNPPELNWFGFRIGWNRGMYFADGDPVMISEAEAMPMSRNIVSSDMAKKQPVRSEKEVQIRKNFAETVFFEPYLKLSNSADASFSFKVPDALTTYKFRALAHDRSLNFSEISHELVNRKQLMVSSYLPYFFRYGDEASIKVKVQNASKTLQEGIVRLRFFDARSGRAVDVLEIGADHKFSLLAGEESIITYRFKAPDKINLLKYELSAKGTNHTDIEEGYIKLLPTTLLIAESYPFEVEAGEQRELTYHAFQNRSSTVAKNNLYKVEYSRDPRWLAVYALPAVLQEEDDCAERVFSNLYTRAIGKFTASKIDGLEAFSKQLEQKGRIASELELNQDVTLINYEYTPWLKAAESEALQRKGLNALFNEEKTEDAMKHDLEKLEQLQLPSGAWPWFKGMYANRYLTHYILGGLERLDQLEVIKDQNELSRLKRIKSRAAQYVDAQIEEDYARISKVSIDPSQDYLSPSMAYYLYARSFDKNWSLGTAASFYIEEAKSHWQTKNPMLRALIGLSLYQMNPSDPLTKSIFISLQDIAITDSLGVHWKFNDGRPFWYNSKIEAQAYLIEFFQLIRPNDPMIDEMKKWLLHQKNQQYWPGSKSNIQACHALLSDERRLIYDDDQSVLKVGNEILEQNSSSMPAVLSKSWQGEAIKSELAKLEVNQSEESFGWGAVHWQYFEESDQVSAHSKNGLRITSTYYTFNDKKDQLKKIDVKLKVGELVKHRLMIEVDYDLEYVYISDQAPACLQAPQMRSGISYLDGLLFYQNMKANEKQWFIERLPRGTYVLETDYRVSHSGKFTGGVSRMQCMYAPEFVAYDNAGSLEVE